MIVFVTGATAGFGAAIARRFVREGHRVIAAGRRQDRLDALKAELGDALLPFVLDVLDAEAVAALPGSLPEGWREVDVLVNNAGLALGLEPAQRADLNDWDRMIGTNCSGLVHMTRALLPGMVERNRGHVINIGSIAGTYPYPGQRVWRHQGLRAAVLAESAGRSDGHSRARIERRAGPVLRYRVLQRAFQGRRRPRGEGL